MDPAKLLLVGAMGTPAVLGLIELGRALDKVDLLPALFALGGTVAGVAAAVLAHRGADTGIPVYMFAAALAYVVGIALDTFADMLLSE